MLEHKREKHSKITIECYAKDILKFRKDAFLFILVLILFLYYVMMNLLLISPLVFTILSLATIFFFAYAYIFPQHNLKSRFVITKKGITCGIIPYRWSYFTRFYVLKSKDMDYFFLKGHLFDSVFPIVMPVEKDKSKIVFNRLREHLIYEEW